MAAPVLQIKRGVFSNLPALKAGEPGFTTDKFDLYVGLDNVLANNKFFGSHRYWERETTTVGSSVRIVEGSSNGDNYIALKSPDSLSSNLTYTFPGTQGAANSVLTNNGSGVLTWGSGSANPIFSGIATFNTTEVDINSAVDISGITTISNTTQSVSVDTGALIVDGGVGVEKNLYVGGVLAVTGVATVTSDLKVGGATTITGNLFVAGQSEFIGIVTFRGGTISIGDADTDDVVVGGEFASNLIPTTDDLFSLGSSSKQWKDLFINGTADIDALTVSGVSTFSSSLLGTQANFTGIATAKQLSNYRALVGAASSETETFIVTVADKTANHRYFGTGSSHGYYIDGKESPFITLLPGKTYRFDQSHASNSSHPILFYFEANKTTQYTTNVTTTGTAGNAGAFVEITITDLTPIVLYYQCSNHAGMGNAISNYSNFINTPHSITTLGGLSVTGVSTLSGQLNANGGIAVDTSAFTVADTTGNTSIAGTLAVTGTTTLTGLLDANGGAEIDNIRIGVANDNEIDTSSGNLTLDSAGGTVAIDDNATVAGTLGVTGATTLSSTLGVTGNTTLSGTLDLGHASDTTIARSSAGTVTIEGVTVATETNTLTLTNKTINLSSNTLVATSAQLAAALTDETGTGSVVFSANPTFTGTLNAAAVATSGNVTIGGNLFVTGTTTEINTETLKVEDSLIEIGLINSSGSLVAPTSDLNIDIGVLFHYFSGSAKKAAVFWDDSASRIVFADEVTESSSVLTVAANAYASIEVESIFINDCAGQSQLITCSGTTRSLENITIDGGSFWP